MRSFRWLLWGCFFLVFALLFLPIRAKAQGLTIDYSVSQNQTATVGSGFTVVTFTGSITNTSDAPITFQTSGGPVPFEPYVASFTGGIAYPGITLGAGESTGTIDLAIVTLQPFDRSLTYPGLVKIVFVAIDPRTGNTLAENDASIQVVHQAAGQINTVFIILMENHDWSQIKGNPLAPYINGTLLPMSSYAEQYFNPTGIHPSLPNYLWLEAGDNFGIFNDGLPAVNHQSTTSHLVSLLENAGLTWKSYQEDISGIECPLTNFALYAPKHNPMVYFDDVTDTNDPASAHCIAHVRPYSEIETDFTNGTVANYNFITPNLCNDMHDCGVDVGDTWLSNEVPKILNSPVYQSGGALFVTWDEGRGSSDGPIGFIALSPFAKGNGYSNTIRYTHSSTLRTIETIFGLAPLLGDAANATDLSDLFVNF